MDVEKRSEQDNRESQDGVCADSCAEIRSGWKRWSDIDGTIHVAITIRHDARDASPLFWRRLRRAGDLIELAFAEAFSSR